VHRPARKSFDGVLGIGGDKHQRRSGFRQHVHQFRTLDAGHFDVEEHGIRMMLRDGRKAQAAILRGSHHRQPWQLVEQVDQVLPGQWLVFDDHNPDHACLQ